MVRRIGLIGHQRSVEQRSSLYHSHLRLSVHCHSAALATAFVLYTFVYFVPATSRYVVSLLRTAVRCIVIDCSVLQYTPKLLKTVEAGVGIQQFDSHATYRLDHLATIDDVITKRKNNNIYVSKHFLNFIYIFYQLIYYII